ncbi:MAG: hypothetical protein ACAI44_40900 [Candidatus Sericytochromatia bacterium]
MGRVSGLKFFAAGSRGILEYTPPHAFRGLLVIWICYGLFALLVSLMFPSQVELRCQRLAAASCRIEKAYLHPLRIWQRSREDIPLDQLKDAHVREVEGDESDSYEVWLDRKDGSSIYLFTPWLESTAEDKAEDLALFIKTPAEETLRLKNLNWVFLLIFDLPVWLLSLQLLITLVLRRAGRPFNSYRLIIDPDRRKVIKLKVGPLGGFHPQEFALNQVQGLHFAAGEDEQQDQLTLRLKLKSGSEQAMLPPIKPPAFASARYFHNQAEQFNAFLAASLASIAKGGKAAG